MKDSTLYTILNHDAHDYDCLMDAARRHAARGDEERAEAYAAMAADLFLRARDEWDREKD